MKRLVLIGGGDNGGNLSGALERQVADLFAEPKRHAVFVPFASEQVAEAYAEFRAMYEGIGFTTVCLDESGDVASVVLAADLVYLGAGSTLRLLETCQLLGLDQTLQEAYERGVTIAGFSAGANVLCQRSVSSEMVADGHREMIAVAGLGLVELFCCTHFNYENRREAFLHQLQPSEVGIGLDDHTAFVVTEEGCRVFTAREHAHVYRVTKQDDQIQQVVWQDGGTNMTETRIPAHISEEFESERLIIRCPRPQEDAAVLGRAVLSSLEELKPWMPWAHKPYNLEEQVESLEKARRMYMERTDFRLLLFSKETGELVGSSGVHRFNWEVGKFEIGYWVVTEHAGKGYITEAVERITQFCIEELYANRVEIRCNSKNERSAAVAKRLRFTLEGILRNDDREVDGTLSDTMVFSKVRGVEFT